MKQLHRSALIVLGLIFVSLGALGVVLPVLPTVPFLLLALWCFARSSRRLHNWLYHHALLGEFLKDWEQHQIIPLSAKIIAIGSMAASACYVIFFTDTALPIIALMLAVMGYGAWFVLTKPSRTY